MLESEFGYILFSYSIYKVEDALMLNIRYTMDRGYVNVGDPNPESMDEIFVKGANQEEDL